MVFSDTQMAVADDENTPQLAVSEVENERLQINHHVTKLAMGGSILLAPFDVTRPNLKILDSGTSDGQPLQRRLHTSSFL